MSEFIVPDEELVIADAVRSPLGLADGTLASIRPAVLLANTASALLDRTLLEPHAVTKVLVAGGADFEGIAREACGQIGLAPLPVAPSGTRGSHGSILRAAAKAVGPNDVVLVLATTKPEPKPLSPSRRRIVDAEQVARQWQLGRDELDSYARTSRQRAREVAAMGEFSSEIVPAAAWSPDSCSIVTADETVTDRAQRAARWLALDPEDVRRHPELAWRLHAGNVSHPAIGAAATILLGHDRAMELGIRPRARILAMAASADAPGTQACGPIRASRAVFERTGIDPNDLDHYEISESFSSIPLAWRHEFDADVDRFNPRGGSIGLGSPGPASGLRSLATTLAALQATGGRLGIQATEGRGSAGDAVLIEYFQRPCCSRDVLHGELHRAS